MRHFNLEEAKAGKPVVTRGGRGVRIVSFNLCGPRPLLCLAQTPDGKDEGFSCTESGRVSSLPDNNYSNDLFMKTEVVTMYVNVYRNRRDGYNTTSRMYLTESEAGRYTSPLHPHEEYICTSEVKVTI